MANTTLFAIAIAVIVAFSLHAGSLNPFPPSASQRADMAA